MRSTAEEVPASIVKRYRLLISFNLRQHTHMWASTNLFINHLSCQKWHRGVTDVDVVRFCLYHFSHSPFLTMAAVEEREGSDVVVLCHMRPTNSDATCS